MEDLLVKRKDASEQLGIHFFDNTLVIRNVVRGHAAARAGLERFVHWRLVKACGKDVASKQDLHSACRKKKELPFVLQNVAEECSIERQDASERLGMGFLDPERSLLLLDAHPGFAAEASGAAAYLDWLLVACNGVKVASLAELQPEASQQANLKMQFVPVFCDVEITRDPGDMLGIVFDGDEKTELYLKNISPHQVADKHDCSRFIGWRISQVDGVRVKRLTELREATEGRGKFTIRFAPSGPTQKVVSVVETINRLELTVRHASNLTCDMADIVRLAFSVDGVSQETSPAAVLPGGTARWEERLEVFTVARPADGCTIEYSMASASAGRISNGALQLSGDELKALLCTPAAWDCALPGAGTFVLDLRSHTEGDAEEALRTLADSGELTDLTSLELYVLGAQGLRLHGALADSSDPVLVVNTAGDGLYDDSRRTKVRTQTSRPEWRERFDFDLKGNKDDFTLQCVVKDNARGDSFLGESELVLDGEDLDKILVRPRRRQLRLGLRGSGSGEAGQHVGIVFLLIRTQTKRLPCGSHLSANDPPEPPPTPPAITGPGPGSGGGAGSGGSAGGPRGVHPEAHVLLRPLEDFARLVGADWNPAQVLAAAHGIEDQLCDKLQSQYPMYADRVEYLREFRQQRGRGRAGAQRGSDGPAQGRVDELERENNDLRRQLREARLFAATLPAQTVEVRPSYPAPPEERTPAVQRHPPPPDQAATLTWGNPRRRRRDRSKQRSPAPAAPSPPAAQPRRDPTPNSGTFFFNASDRTLARNVAASEWKAGRLGAESPSDHEYRREVARRTARGGGAAGRALQDEYFRTTETLMWSLGEQHASPERSVGELVQEFGDVDAGDWAQISSAAPVRLRSAPHDSADRLPQAGVHGAVRVQKYAVGGRWALVEGEGGNAGYLRTQYLTFPDFDPVRDGDLRSPSESSLGPSIWVD